MDEKTVFERQQEDHFVRLLAAQAQLYTEYERNHGMWIAIATLIAIVGTGIVATSSTIAPYIALLSLAIMFGESSISLATINVRKEAARIQELYDCELPKIPWNATEFKRPRQELIVEAAEKHLSQADEKEYIRLRTWYDAEISNRSIRETRILCQRYNLYWDSDLRQKWSWWIFGSLALLAIAILVTAVVAQMTVAALLVAVLLPLPIFKLGIQNAMGHRRPAVELDELKIYADSLLAKANDPAVSDLELQHASRLLQDRIFLNRRESPKVPDRFYRWNRDRLQRILAQPNP